MHKNLRALLLACGLTAPAFCARSQAQGGIQQGFTAPELTLTDAIESLAARSADIFTGEVLSIERRGATVEVGFAVEQTLGGSASGRYTLREWAGLWPQGQSRYRIGQRVLIFVRPASAAGISSPVDQDEGVLPLTPNGAGEAPGQVLVDARRLDARLERSVGQPLPDASQAAIALDDIATTIRIAQAPGEQRHTPLPRRFPLSPVKPIPPTTPAMPVHPWIGRPVVLPGSLNVR